MTLLDQSARDRIARDHATTLFVEAGAGSGKTSSLVARFVSLVVAGRDVTEIAAITFTEAAASELRTRVRQTLEQIERNEPVRGIAPSPDAAARAKAALDDLDRATICTLHAFAQRILLSAPVEAELPPGLEVHDNLSSALRFEERWQRFERQLLEADDLEAVMRAAFVLRVDARHRQAMAHTFTQNWDLVEEIVSAGAVDDMRRVPVDIDAVPVDVLLAAWDRVIDLGTRCQDRDDLLFRWIQEVVVPRRDQLQRHRDDLFALIEVLNEDIPKARSKGKAANWPEQANLDVIAARDEAIEAGQAAIAELVDAVLTRLGAEIALYSIDDADRRRREGRLEFHDLLVLARRLLRRSETVRRRLHDQYHHLLIDEFQDTDPIQIELAVRIAADPGHDTTRPWDEVDVDEGRLFFVGDPKQSIYRFRRADIDLFARTAAKHAGGYTSLSVNFRTVGPILEFCNAIFGHLIRSEQTGEGEARRTAQPAYVPLDVARAVIDDDPGPAVLLLGDGAPHDRADTARAAEARDVAAALSEAKRDGWLVDEEGQPRRCTWADMAVLLPSRSTLAHLRSALDDDGIPYRLETGTLIFGTTEIIDLMSILRAIDDPGDHVAIVGALRSGAYGCGDDELRRWVRESGRTLSYLGSELPSEHELASAERPVGRVEAGLADLRHRHRAAPFLTIPEIVDGVIRGRQLMQLSLAGGRHRDSWRLYRTVLEAARHFADREAGGLRDFVRWANLQRDDKVQTPSPALPEADIDAVRVLTIHASKGLEFPITAVSGLSAQDPTGLPGPTVLFRRPAGTMERGGIEVRMHSGMETTRFQATRTVEETMDIHERIRLLYVALTRARDHLIVSTHHTERAQARSHGGRLSATVDLLEAERGTTLAPRRHADADTGIVDGSGRDGADQMVLDLRADAVPSQAPPEPMGAEHDAWLRTEARWRDERTAMLARSRAVAVTATGLAALARSAPLDADPPDGVRVGGDDDERLPDREPWRRGRAGTSIGSAVHAVLQHADLTDTSGAGLGELSHWHAMAEGVPDAAAEIEAKARAGVTSNLVRRAVASGRWQREVHVGVALSRIDDAYEGDHIFEGFIDLVFDDGAGLVVVDYKTDAVTSEAEVARALDRYRLQGAAYAVALEAALGRPVTEVHFLFLRGAHLGDHVAHDAVLADLGKDKAEVRQALEAPSRSRI